MLRTTLASSRVLRVCVLGLATITTAVIFTTDTADARRHRSRHHVRHVAKPSYSPAFSSIIVDANSGATLTANNPDAIRHPASLTKIMTLYLLFERLEAGKLKLDSELEVSEHASEQAPTKLGLRPGQTIKVEDAIKGLVTRSANDASVVIAEAISGDEDDFAKLMTRKARALGMSKTVYRNANGLPNPEQVTTARDQATLGRAIQDRFPRYYRYFATSTFVYRGHAIRNHNRLLGNVEGVDGIKTGYTRASGFNLVTSMRRGNRHLVGVVLGGRSGGSRDAIMRSLLAENLAKGATNRTVAAITERSVSEANADVAEAETAARPTQTVQAQAAIQVASAAPEPAAAATTRSIAPAAKPSVLAAATAAVPPPQARTAAVPQARTEPAAADIRRYSNPAARRNPRFVRADEAGPGEDGSGQGRTDQAGLCRSGPAGHTDHPRDRAAARSAGDIRRRGGQGRGQQGRVANDFAKTQPAKNQIIRTEMPPQPANHGTGNGILGVLPASSAPPARPRLPGDGLCRAGVPRLSRRPFSRTSPSSRPAPTPAGSFRSAPSKAKARRWRASKPRAARPRACSPRPSRSPSRWSPRANGSCSGPASPASTAIRPRRCARR